MDNNTPVHVKCYVRDIKGTPERLSVTLEDGERKCFEFNMEDSLTGYKFKVGVIKGLTWGNSRGVHKTLPDTVKVEPLDCFFGGYHFIDFLSHTLRDIVLQLYKSR